MNPQGLHDRRVRQADRRRSWRTTSSGGSARPLPAPGRSACSTGRTTRTCWSSGCTIWCRSGRGRPATTKINDFERALAADGVTIIKVMLHISHDGAGASGSTSGCTIRRSTGSTTRPTSTSARSGTTTRRRTPMRCANARPTGAPWYVVPANRKWYRDWAVATILLRTRSADLSLHYPPPDFDRGRGTARGWRYGVNRRRWRRNSAPPIAYRA